MRIKLTSIFVKDQEKALRFYTGILGFVEKSDIPAGEYRWLTVVSPEDPNGIELVLEPNINPAARAYQEAIFNQGIPATMFFVDDIQKEYDKLKKMGVAFKSGPTEAGPAIIAIFDDSCGNFIQISQVKGY
jgi:catechol 2,3-dioxygenase-like lactoylglutathione lyase family enzyme